MDQTEKFSIKKNIWSKGSEVSIVIQVLAGDECDEVAEHRIKIPIEACLDCEELANAAIIETTNHIFDIIDELTCFTDEAFSSIYKEMPNVLIAAKKELILNLESSKKRAELTHPY